MSRRVLVPREWETTEAIRRTEKPALVVKVARRGGKQIAAFNGSENNPRRKKRPITLPERA